MWTRGIVTTSPGIALKSMMLVIICAVKSMILAPPGRPTVKRGVPFCSMTSGTSWMSVARMVRGQVLSLKEQEFVLAARAAGAGAGRLIVRQLMPNAVAPVLVAATLTVATAILLESSLSYLGYGIQPPTASWGNMLNNAQSYVLYAPWVAVYPGAMISLTVLSFNFAGDGLRDALDPRLGP